MNEQNYKFFLLSGIGLFTNHRTLEQTAVFDENRTDDFYQFRFKVELTRF